MPRTHSAGSVGAFLESPGDPDYDWLMLGPDKDSDPDP
eukprot:gene7411-6952_t